ncbi:MAG TPA: DUF3089 domain-containing protein [Alphaproteobacteria bacterium]|nr:DUF3089 domain-containing protein [Alphaproteobacteria bacterium]
MKRYLLYGLISLAIIGTVAFGFRREILMYMITPGDEFAAYQPPPAPDYADPATWAAHPDRADNADLVPPVSGAENRQALAKVDVFYIHPTTNYRGNGWNAALDDPRVNQITDQGTIKHQASAFNSCCRIFAPRYRQATLAAFMAEAGQNGRLALELAYQDVRAAFDYYLQHENGGRPFIIASHSQGTRHAYKLISETINGTPLADRLVAAYLIGFPRQITDDGRMLGHWQVCDAPAQTGCIVSWNTMLEGGDPTQFRNGVATNGALDTLPRTAPDGQIACVNPLSWRTDNARAGRQSHLGAIPFSRDADSGIPEPRPELLEAWCEDGFLFVTDPGDEFRILRMPEGNYHNYDYNLFYMNIRENALTRTNSFLANPRKAAFAHE